MRGFVNGANIERGPDHVAELVGVVIFETGSGRPNRFVEVKTPLVVRMIAGDTTGHKLMGQMISVSTHKSACFVWCGPILVPCLVHEAV